MLVWCFQVIFLSALVIFLFHQLFEYFKDLLTVPFTKDLVNLPMRRYGQIDRVIGGSQPVASRHQESPSSSSESMRQELKQFMRGQLGNMPPPGPACYEPL